jgi:Na+/proline symporter
MEAKNRAIIGLVVWLFTMIWFYKQIDWSGPDSAFYGVLAGICSLIVTIVCVSRLLPNSNRLDRGGRDEQR